MLERKAGRTGDHGERDRRKRARPARNRPQRAPRGRTEQAVRERCGIAVEDDMIGRERVAAVKPHPAGAAADQDLRHLLAEAEADAMPLGERGNRPGERRDPAIDEPDPGRLDMGDQHERGRRAIGRASGIGGVAAEQLDEAGIAEVAGERPGERRVGPQRDEIGKPAEPEPPAETEWRGALPAQEGGIEGAMDAAGLGHEGKEGARLGRSGEGRDGIGRGAEIGEEVEPAAIRPGVAREADGGRKADMILEPAAGILEQLVEHMAQGEDGGPGIDRPNGAGGIGDGKLADAAAGGCAALDDGDVEAAGGQRHGGGKAPDSGADDHHPLRPPARHGRSLAAVQGNGHGKASAAMGVGRMSLAAHARRWRNRLVGDPRFQALALRIPGVRAIGRARARRLFDLTSGFVASQVLSAALSTGLLARLAEGPATAGEAAEATGLSAEALACLLVAAEGLDLVERLADGRVMLGMTGAELLANPGIPAMVAHHPLLWADLADPRAFLDRPPGGGALARFWPYAADQGGSEGGDSGPYSRLMAASQPLVAAQALAAHDFGRHRCLLDVGGGEGAFLAAVGARHPRLSRMLFDLPAVAERAAARLGAGVRVVTGDFRIDPLPEGADAVSLVRILHDHDDAVAAALLAKIHAVLPNGGTLIVCEPMAGTRSAPAVGTYFAFYLRAMGSGRPRTADEIADMCRAAGFGWVRERPTPLPLGARVLVARKSGGAKRRGPGQV